MQEMIKTLREKIDKKSALILVGVVGIVGIIGYFIFRTYTVQSSVAGQFTPDTQGTIPKVTQLRVQDFAVGTGPEVKSGDTVVIHYNGLLTNGQVFDSSYARGKPFETQIGVGRVIKGWDVGVVGMKAGGKRRLIIPPDLGYGDQAMGPIPANSTLVFDVELLEVK